MTPGEGVFLLIIEEHKTVSDEQLANRLVPCKDPRERNVRASMVSTFQRPGEQGLWEQGLWSPLRLKGKQQN